VISAARAALLAFLLSTISLRAGAPTLEAIYPPGAAGGSSNSVTFSGKFEPWPPKVWVSGAGLEFSAQTNKGKFTVTISNSAAPGPRVVRVYNEDGASEPRLFVVGAEREINDTETNNHFADAQPIGELPVTINGRLDKTGDVDSFALHLRVNEWLDARVDSYTMMSKLDGVLRLVTTNGQQLAWNHDFATLDPRLIWQATNDGTFVLQIYGFPHPATSDVKLYGGDNAFYRLRIAALGRDPLQDYPSTAQPSLLDVNSVMLTNIEQRYEFAATADQFLQVKVGATVLGSPLDAWVKVEDSAGKELTRNDDAEGSRDPSLEWKAPTNGTYRAVVGSFTHRSGPDYRYRLTIQPLTPDFRGTLAANSLVVTPDSTNTIKLNVKRLRGYTNELLVSIPDLPDGITAVSTNVSSSGGDVNLQLLAATNALPFSGPIQIALSDRATRQRRIVPFMLTSRTEDNGVPGGYSALLIDHLDHLWLTVKPQPAEKPKETAKK
jgi:hypothetical protein